MGKPARALAVLFAVNCLNIYDRQVLGALAEPLRKEFGLSDMQIGALSTLFTLVYAVAGVPLGRLADGGSRRRLLAAGVAVWGALTALGGLAASYTALLLSRLGVAAGEAVCAPAATSWIGDLYPPERRARALARFMFGVPLGVALSFAVSGPVAQAWGWRSAMLLAAAPALALVPALLALPEPPRGNPASAAAATPWTLLRLPAFLWIVASGALVNFALYTVSTFLPAFLSRFHGLSVAGAGFWAGIGSGVAGVLGGVAAGAWGDRRASAPGRLRAAAVAAAAAAPAAVAGIALPPGQAAGAIALLMCAYGLLNMYYGLVYAAIQDLVAPRLRGTAMAVYFMAMYLCGASFGPLVTGGLSDLLARSAAAGGPLTEAARAAGLHQAMYVIAVFAAALAVVLARAARSASRASTTACR
jgi:predicted MFS family arabinose efflux permease